MMGALGSGMPCRVHEPKIQTAGAYGGRISTHRAKAVMRFLFSVLNAPRVNQILMRRHSRSQHEFIPGALLSSLSVL